MKSKLCGSICVYFYANTATEYGSKSFLPFITSQVEVLEHSFVAGKA